MDKLLIQAKKSVNDVEDKSAVTNSTNEIKNRYLILKLFTVFLRCTPSIYSIPQ
jgi:hypothetical protein